VTTRIRRRGLGLTAALALTPIAAWRFAHAYRSRAGFPRQNAPIHDPSAVGLPFEELAIPSAGVQLPAWWIPADGAAPAPAVLLVHGWESARDRTLPNALILHEIGFHVLTVDIRAHGANPPELLPLTAGEFGADALAGVRYLLDHAAVTSVGILGHSMGAVGALLAAAAEPRVAAVVAVSAPAGPYRLTRLTFRLASLPIPDVIAYPLAWLTTRIYLKPRGHAVADVSSTEAIGRYAGPTLLIHGTEDDVVPPGHLGRLERSARRARSATPGAAAVEVLTIAGGRHSWLFESRIYRSTVAAFLARALGGPLTPEEAAAKAAEVPAIRLPEPDHGFSVLDDEPGGFRTIVRGLRHA
jgi:pimeloyl-ACP methyl ester carboxylesterase